MSQLEIFELILESAWQMYDSYVKDNSIQKVEGKLFGTGYKPGKDKGAWIPYNAMNEKNGVATSYTETNTEGPLHIFRQKDAIDISLPGGTPVSLGFQGIYLGSDGTYEAGQTFATTNGLSFKASSAGYATSGQFLLMIGAPRNSRTYNQKVDKLKAVVGLSIGDNVAQKQYLLPGNPTEEYFKLAKSHQDIEFRDDSKSSRAATMMGFMDWNSKPITMIVNVKLWHITPTLKPGTMFYPNDIVGIVNGFERSNPKVLWQGPHVHVEMRALLPFAPEQYKRCRINPEALFRIIGMNPASGDYDTRTYVKDNSTRADETEQDPRFHTVKENINPRGVEVGLYVEDPKINKNLSGFASPLVYKTEPYSMNNFQSAVSGLFKYMKSYDSSQILRETKGYGAISVLDGSEMNSYKAMVMGIKNTAAIWGRDSNKSTLLAQPLFKLFDPNDENFKKILRENKIMGDLPNNSIEKSIRFDEVYRWLAIPGNNNDDNNNNNNNPQRYVLTDPEIISWEEQKVTTKGVIIRLKEKVQSIIKNRYTARDLRSLCEMVIYNNITIDQKEDKSIRSLASFFFDKLHFCSQEAEQDYNFEKFGNIHEDNSAAFKQPSGPITMMDVMFRNLEYYDGILLGCLLLSLSGARAQNMKDNPPYGKSPFKDQDEESEFCFNGYLGNADADLNKFVSWKVWVNPKRQAMIFPYMCYNNDLNLLLNYDFIRGVAPNNNKHLMETIYSYVFNPGQIIASLNHAIVESYPLGISKNDGFVTIVDRPTYLACTNALASVMYFSDEETTKMIKQLGAEAAMATHGVELTSRIGSYEIAFHFIKNIILDSESLIRFAKAQFISNGGWLTWGKIADSGNVKALPKLKALFDMWYGTNDIHNYLLDDKTFSYKPLSSIDSTIEKKDVNNDNILRYVNMLLTQTDSDELSNNVAVKESEVDDYQTFIVYRGTVSELPQEEVEAFASVPVNNGIIASSNDNTQIEDNQGGIMNNAERLEISEHLLIPNPFVPEMLRTTTGYDFMRVFQAYTTNYFNQASNIGKNQINIPYNKGTFGDIIPSLFNLKKWILANRLRQEWIKSKPLLTPTDFVDSKETIIRYFSFNSDATKFSQTIKARLSNGTLSQSDIQNGPIARLVEYGKTMGNIFKSAFSAKTEEELSGLQKELEDMIPDNYQFPSNAVIDPANFYDMVIVIIGGIYYGLIKSGYISANQFKLSTFDPWKDLADGMYQLDQLVKS